VLLEGEEEAAGRHPSRRGAAEVPVLGRQLEAGGMERRVGLEPAVDPAVPPPREVDGEAVGGELHPIATATATASAASASCAASAAERTGRCRLRMRSWNAI